MKKRRGLQKGKSRKMFKKSAKRTHVKNISPRSMRGGNRL